MFIFSSFVMVWASFCTEDPQTWSNVDFNYVNFRLRDKNLLGSLWLDIQLFISLHVEKFGIYTEGF